MQRLEMKGLEAHLSEGELFARLSELVSMNAGNLLGTDQASSPASTVQSPATNLQSPAAANMQSPPLQEQQLPADLTHADASSHLNQQSHVALSRQQSSSGQSTSHDSPQPQGSQSVQTSCGQPATPQQSSSNSNGEPLFTIEQVELVRRLRRSGLSIDQFVEAYKEMDRLDRELSPDQGDLQLDPASESITATLNQLLPNTSFSSNTHNSYHGQSSMYSAPSSVSALGNQYTMLTSIFGDDVSPQELIEFKKKGEKTMMAEIRAFVSKYNIRQQMIAEMTHISQGYISTFFHGEKMSEKRKNVIYQWYLTYSKDPGRLLRDHANMTMVSQVPRFETDGEYSGELTFPVTRRDRFIFRKQHLKILEQYFMENPYPEIHAKEQIVEECNQQAERISGKPLKESDKVTVAIVSNWFNNRRKNVRSRQVKQLTQVGFPNLPGLSGLQGLPSLQDLQNLQSLQNLPMMSGNGNGNAQEHLNAAGSVSRNGGMNLESGGSNSNNQPYAMGSAAGGNSQQSSYVLNSPQMSGSNQQGGSMQQMQHQDTFDSNSFQYDCSYSSHSTPPASEQSLGRSQQQQQLSTRGSASMQQQQQMMSGGSMNNGVQFKTEPYNQFLSECFDKIGPVRKSEDGIPPDHEESNISEFSSQASFNGNDSID